MRFKGNNLPRVPNGYCSGKYRFSDICADIHDKVTFSKIGPQKRQISIAFMWVDPQGHRGIRWMKPNSVIIPLNGQKIAKSAEHEQPCPDELPGSFVCAK